MEHDWQIKGAFVGEMRRVRSAALLAELIKSKGLSYRRIEYLMPGNSMKKSHVANLIKGHTKTTSAEKAANLARLLGVGTDVLFAVEPSRNDGRSAIEDDAA